MIRIIRESKVEHFQELSLNYDTNRYGGYSFPCNAKGEVNLDELSDAAKFNYELCTTGQVETIRPPYVHERTWTDYSPAIGECYCGGEVELKGDHEGLCYCHCGACYNSAGQAIRPRSEWEEDY